jgi:hypothetical protein
LDVHRAARICAAGHGGQVLISSSTRELVADELPSDVALRNLGEHRLKDLDRPEQLVVGDLPANFPALASLSPGSGGANGLPPSPNRTRSTWVRMIGSPSRRAMSSSAATTAGCSAPRPICHRHLAYEEALWLTEQPGQDLTTAAVAALAV